MTLYQIQKVNVFDEDIHTTLILHERGGVKEKYSTFKDGIYHFFFDNSASMEMNNIDRFTRIKKKLCKMIQHVIEKTENCEINLYTFSDKIVDITDITKESIISIQAFGVSNYEFMYSKIQSIMHLESKSKRTITEMRFVVIGDGEDSYNDFYETEPIAFQTLPSSMQNNDYRVRMYCFSTLEIENEEDNELQILSTFGNVTGNYYRNGMWNVLDLIYPTTFWSDANEYVQGTIPLANGYYGANVFFNPMNGKNISVKMYENYKHINPIDVKSTNFLFSFIATMAFVKRNMDLTTSCYLNCINYLKKYIETITEYQNNTTERNIYICIIYEIISLLNECKENYNYIDSKKFVNILNKNITFDIKTCIEVNKRNRNRNRNKDGDGNGNGNRKKKRKINEKTNIYNRLLEEKENLVAICNIDQIYSTEYYVRFGTFNELYPIFKESESILMVPMYMTYLKSKTMMQEYNIMYNFSHYEFLVSHFIGYSPKLCCTDKRKLLYDIVTAGKMTATEYELNNVYKFAEEYYTNTKEKDFKLDPTFSIGKIMFSSLSSLSRMRLAFVISRNYICNILDEKSDSYHTIKNNDNVRKTILSSIGSVKEFDTLKISIYNDRRAQFLEKYVKQVRNKVKLSVNDVRLWEDTNIPAAAGVLKTKESEIKLRNLLCETPITVKRADFNSVIELIDMEITAGEWDTLSMLLSRVYNQRVITITKFNDIFMEETYVSSVAMILQILDGYSGGYINANEYIRSFREKEYMKILDSYVKEKLNNIML